MAPCWYLYVLGCVFWFPAHALWISGPMYSCHVVVTILGNPPEVCSELYSTVLCTVIPTHEGVIPVVGTHENIGFQWTPRKCLLSPEPRFVSLIEYLECSSIVELIAINPSSRELKRLTVAVTSLSVALVVPLRGRIPFWPDRRGYHAGRAWNTRKETSLRMAAL